jgi:STE24 endopeptidase
VGAAPDRRWAVSLAAALALAEAAVVVLRPRDGLIEGQPVDPREHFDAAQIARARRYGRGQMALGGAAALSEAIVLATLLDRRRRRDGHDGGLLAVAAHGAGLSLTLATAALPFGALMRKRALAAGLATQSWRGWGADVARTAALGAAFSASGSVIVMALMRRYGPRWWLAAGVGATGVAVLVTLVGPVVLEPIFNDFTPLPEGELRSEVIALAQRAGVRIGEVYEVDASRRTTAANAYVNGIGATRRVVLYDTLTSTFSAGEARTVIAHELAHVRYRDVPRLLVFVALVAPAAMRAVARVAERLEGGEMPGLEALALAGGAVSAATGVVTRQLSRAIERRADSYSLALTDDPASFVAFEERITAQNLADPDPPGWLVNLLGTHPPIVERIGTAAAYAAGARPTRRRPGRPTSRRTREGS